MPIEKNKKFYWSLAAGWTLLIYSTLYIVRPITAYLNKKIPFPETINIVCWALIILLLMGVIERVKIRKISSYFILGGVVVAYAAGLMILKIPEEKVHFIEYGVLSVLIYKALEFDIKSPWSFILALLLTTVLGSVDEGIQYYLPNRYCHLNDMILNSISGALTLLAMFVIHRERSDD